MARERKIRSIVGLQATQGLIFRKVKALIDSGEIEDVLSTVMVRDLIDLYKNVPLLDPVEDMGIQDDKFVELIQVSQPPYAHC
ncbi:hypothetical protein CPB85DRAFT_816849 [Mucidula mucida]|nr:hypothetical protein CPB85DRAFT_816849 [Mucidula mucida]